LLADLNDVVVEEGRKLEDAIIEGRLQLSLLLFEDNSGTGKGKVKHASRVDDGRCARQKSVRSILEGRWAVSKFRALCSFP